MHSVCSLYAPGDYVPVVSTNYCTAYKPIAMCIMYVYVLLLILCIVQLFVSLTYVNLPSCTRDDLPLQIVWFDSTTSNLFLPSQYIFREVSLSRAMIRRLSLHSMECIDFKFRLVLNQNWYDKKKYDRQSRHNILSMIRRLSLHSMKFN